jgi:predicted nucleotidyltransferase
MISEIEQHHEEIDALCREYGVERLALFISAAGGFRANSSDLDFLGEFRTPLAAGYANRYFGLLEGLQNLSSSGRSIWLWNLPSVTRTFAKPWTGIRRCCMRLEARKYLYDIKQAADLLGEFTAGKQFTDYMESSNAAPPWRESSRSSARRFRSFP